MESHLKSISATSNFKERSSTAAASALTFSAQWCINKHSQMHWQNKCSRWLSIMMIYGLASLSLSKEKNYLARRELKYSIHSRSHKEGIKTYPFRFQSEEFRLWKIAWRDAGVLIFKKWCIGHRALRLIRVISGSLESRWCGWLGHLWERHFYVVLLAWSRRVCFVSLSLLHLRSGQILNFTFSLVVLLNYFWPARPHSILAS